MEAVKNIQKGAHFLISDDQKEVFSPEDFTEEQLLIRSTLKEFVKNDHTPLADRMENGEHDLNVDLLKKLGDLGFLGTHMPEKYGGLEMDPNTNSVVLEEMGYTGAFSTTYGAHTGIGMLPILYFGTQAQKDKYLPGLIAGELIACYCLTEPGSGSDALAAKTRADLTEDGKHYILNGQKMWITNAGFADVFIVFAKINGEEFTGFIVEKGMEGLSLAAEEKKLGIKGSSTRQVFFENVKVPVDNLLGEAGKGHLIAFNVLNSGRYKIGPFGLGGSKGLTQLSIKYANERVQFGQPISSFGAVKSKLAEQAIQTYVGEAAVYRTSGLIHDYVEVLMSEGKSYAEAELEAAEEYALESSILKVAISETVNFIADECVQVHGGMGFSEETLAARGFRDSRISRIYEGTNEINRMLMINMIFKNAMKGSLDIATPAMAVQQELLTGVSENKNLSEEEKAVKGFKKIAMMLIGTAGQLTMKGKLDLKEEQEVLMNLANIVIDVFLAESMILRYQKNNQSGKGAPKEIRTAIMEVFLRGATERVRAQAIEAIGSFIKEEKQDSFVDAVNLFCKYPVKNVKNLKREIADFLIDKNEYAL